MNIKADIIIDKQVTDISAVPSRAIVAGWPGQAFLHVKLHGCMVRFVKVYLQ